MEEDLLYYKKFQFKNKDKTILMAEQEAKDLQLEDIFINLKLISHIEPGNKLKPVDDKYINIDSGYLKCISRWLSGSNRNDTVSFLRKLYGRAFTYNDELLKKQDESQQLYRLTNSLKASIDGLNNLKQTYASDVLIRSEIDVIIENIQYKIDNNMKKLKL